MESGEEKEIVALFIVREIISIAILPPLISIMPLRIKQG
jgi:hypothetical protein